MEKGEVFISKHAGMYCIRVKGNASFACSSPLRDLSKTMNEESYDSVSVDLDECTWMDSTFMGMLAMIGRNARKKGYPSVICRASEQNYKLLIGLGLKKVFDFQDEAMAPFGEQPIPPADPASGSTPVALARDVLDAHRTLMDIDHENVAKFEKVVEFVEQDIQKLEKKEKEHPEM